MKTFPNNRCHARQSVGGPADFPRSGERGYGWMRTFQTVGGILEEALILPTAERMYAVAYQLEMARPVTLPTITAPRGWECPWL